MDFSFTSDQQDLRELAAKILSDATTLERTKQVVAESDGFDRTLWAALADAGIVGISLPESVGGAGLGFLETCIVLEEVGRTAAPDPRARGDGPRRARARGVRCHRRARRRRVRLQVLESGAGTEPPSTLRPSGVAGSMVSAYALMCSGARSTVS